MKRVLMILLIAMGSNSLTYAYVSSDYDWQTYNGHQYAITLNWSNWFQAEAWALEVGGHLVTINDAAENTWVAELIKDSYVIPVPQYPEPDPHANLAWIGLEFTGGDMSSPGSWRWTSGEPLTFWNPIESPWYDAFPKTGTHMYIHGANHDTGPMTWNNNIECDIYLYPQGVIEVAEPSVIPAPGALVLAALGMGLVGWLRGRRTI